MCPTWKQVIQKEKKEKKKRGPIFYLQSHNQSLPPNNNYYNYNYHYHYH